jgi:hypothetical protein
MIEIILKFYGFNSDNKWIGYFVTGLTLSVFSIVVFSLIFVKSSSDMTSEVFVKSCSIISITTRLVNYLAIKYKSTEIFELIRKIKKFQNKSLISQLNAQIFSIFSILLSFLMAFFMTVDYFCEANVTELFKDLIEKIDTLPIPSFLQIFILSFHQYSWFIAIQLLYIELKTRYISIIKEFEKQVNEKSEPDIDLLVLTEKYVLKFVNFKNGIKRNVDFLKLTISMDFFCLITYMISFHVLISNSECFPFGIPRILLLIGYYLWTITSNLRIRIVENDLSFVLNRWLHLNSENSIQIEMDYIERAAKRSDDKESNDENNEI